MAIQYIVLLKQNKDPRATHAVFQVEQGGNRMPSGIGCAPCIMPKGKYVYTHYGFGGPKFLTPMEKCWLQGIGPEERSALGLTYDAVAQALLADLADFTEKGRRKDKGRKKEGRMKAEALLADLAGNAFSANVVVAFLFGLFANWRIQ